MKGNEVTFMARTAVRTASVYTRVDPETKEQAEEILNRLGIPMSNAIGMFLKQVVLQRGMPFDMKLPPYQPLDISQMTKEEIDAEIQKGVDDLKAGRTVTIDDLEREMKELYGV